MREIKFGAFDKKDSGWLCRCLSITDLIFRDILEKYAAEIILGDVILVQFTGLLDKHGKEIYEGDILATRRGLEPVFFDQSCFRIGTEHNHSNIDSDLYDTYKTRECVVGNIYENPELLEGDEK
jgi:hypothetical protein